MNNINELYTQLSTSMPERKEPVRSLREGVGSQEITEISDEEAGNILDNVIKFGLQMLPGSEIAREIGASKLEPTISEDIQEGRIGDAALKGVGTASDVALAASPFLGPAGLVVGPAALGVKAATKLLKGKKGVKAGMSQVDETNLTLEEIKEAYKLKESQRRTQPDKLKKLAKDLEEGKITKTKWDEEVKKLNPVSMFEEMPVVPSLKRIEAVVGSKATNKIIGKDISLESLDGKRISNRLDIPSYDRYDTWVPTMHNLGKVKGKPGTVIGYGQTAVLKNVDFHTPDMQTPITAALKVSQGASKYPFAGMEGTFKNVPVDNAYNKASEILEQIKRGESDYIQVGYNPHRASYFYDRATGLPVLNAEEVIQVGPLVLAKKPIMGKATDFKFEKGGYVHNYIEGL